MADQKLTEVVEYSTMNDTDKFVANIDSAVRQITLTNLIKIVKTKIGSLKNPNALKFTGAINDSYDGSVAKTINIPSLDVATSTKLGGVKPITKTSDMTQRVGVDSSGGLWTAPSSSTTPSSGSVSYDTSTGDLTVQTVSSIKYDDSTGNLQIGG